MAVCLPRAASASDQPLIPRETLRWKGLYRNRASVEWEFGRLKHEWGLAPLRVRGIKRVRLHADLAILAPEWIADYALRVPGHPPTILSAADGERYLRALPNDFARMTYWSATFHEPIAALIEALEQGGHHDLAKRVRADRDSAFRSPVEGEPKDALVADMLERGEVALGERVEAGEFASSSDELDEWFDSDGGQTALRASEAYRANRRRAEREARERGGL